MTTNEQEMIQFVRYQKVYNTRMAWEIWAEKNNIIVGFNISYLNTLDGINRGLSHTMKVKEIDRNVN